ncbi:hypothetical protein MRX96_023992 [Rhipicephalus microplus]
MLDEQHIRIHPTNNTFIVATTEEATALALVKVQAIAFNEKQYPIVAYLAVPPPPPPAAIKGVISRAYWNETPEEILNDLHCRNPGANIIAGRRMEKICFNFDYLRLWSCTIKYMCVAHRCTKYKGSPDACTNCRKPGHWYNVCPPPIKGTLPTMRRETREARDPLHAEMHPLWREPSYRHRVVQGQDAPALTTGIAETSATSDHDKGLSTLEPHQNHQ